MTKICMLIMNEVIHDGRVIRSAQKLSEVADVTIVGLDKGKIQIDETSATKLVGVPVRYARFGEKAGWGRNLIGYLARYLTAQKQMITLALALEPDVIHAHEYSTLNIAKKVSKKNNAKIVYDCHELYREMSHGLTGLAGIFRNRFENWGLKNSDLIIACNRHRSKIMVEEYGAKTQPVIVKNAVPFKPVNRNEYLTKQFRKMNSPVNQILVYQGGLAPSRCIEELIEALFLIENQSIGLAMIGPSSPDYLNELKQMVQVKNLEKRVLFHSPVPQSELHEIACSGDVGIVLYRPDCRNNYFCAPNKLQEYSMAGMAIIGANNPPISDFFRKYECGVTVDPTSPTDIAEAINEILYSHEKLNFMKKNSAIAAKAECWENISDQLLEGYNSRNLFD